MRRTRLIDYYIEKSQDSDFEINQIRKELELQKLPDEEIRIIVKLVDNAIQKKALAKSLDSEGNELIIAGAVLIIVGIGITIGTYSGLINMGESFLIVYGPFLGGFSMLLGGLAQRRKYVRQVHFSFRKKRE